MAYIWSIVDDEARKEIFDHFAQLHDLSLFPPELTKIEKRRPRFYTKCDHYRVTNYAGIDGPGFKFISDGTHYFYLNGTPAPIYGANKLEELDLAEDHVIAYLAYFLRNTQGEKGEIDLVINNEKSRFITQVSREERERILEREHNIELTFSDKEKSYLASGTLYYDEELIPATFHITRGGIVTLESNGLPIKLKG